MSSKETKYKRIQAERRAHFLARREELIKKPTVEDVIVKYSQMLIDQERLLSFFCHNAASAVEIIENLRMMAYGSPVEKLSARKKQEGLEENYEREFATESFRRYPQR